MLAVLAMSAAQVLSPDAATLVQAATDVLLAGETLPPDFLLGLGGLPADQRLLVIVHLRRTGLMDGSMPPVDVFAVDRVATPARMPDAGPVPDGALPPIVPAAPAEPTDLSGARP